jgi:hypothetical protein
VASIARAILLRIVQTTKRQSVGPAEDEARTEMALRVIKGKRLTYRATDSPQETQVGPTYLPGLSALS